MDRHFARWRLQQQRDLLLRMKDGALEHGSWGGMSPSNFFKQRLLHDIVVAYWSHPTGWNEIGWSGPAAPWLRPDGLRQAGPVGGGRGPWRRRDAALRKTAMSADPLVEPRGKDGRAPDVFRPGGWVPMGSTASPNRWNS